MKQIARKINFQEIYVTRRAKTSLQAYVDNEDPRSACASAHSDQGIHYPIIESLDTTECMKGEQRPGCYYVV